MRWECSLTDRVFVFVGRVLKLYPRISKLGPPYAHIALQLCKAASAIGAALEEGAVGASAGPRDMGLKHAIALRESREANYWLRVLVADGVMKDELMPLVQESREFVAMLTTSVRKLRRRKRRRPIEQSDAA